MERRSFFKGLIAVAALPFAVKTETKPEWKAPPAVGKVPSWRRAVYTIPDEVRGSVTIEIPGEPPQTQYFVVSKTPEAPVLRTENEVAYGASRAAMQAVRRAALNRFPDPSTRA